MPKGYNMNLAAQEVTTIMEKKHYYAFENTVMEEKSKARFQEITL